MQTRMSWLVAAAVVLRLASAVAWADVITHGSTTVTMDLVSIGNAGNAADTTGDPNPCGAVAYPYRIGRYEVSAAQWAVVTGADAAVGNAGNWSGSQPTASTSWHEAAKFCNWLTTGHYDQGYYAIDGGGLATPNALSHQAYWAANGTTFFIPTEDEWYKAAYYNPSGASYYDYPTESDTVPGAVTGGTAPYTAVYGAAASVPAGVDDSGGLGPYGTMGQSGNVWEWNETLIGSDRGLRGGAFGEHGDGHLTGGAGYYFRAVFRASYDPANDSNNTVGFRVAAIGVVPEPTSLALLGLSALALCRRARRRAG